MRRYRDYIATGYSVGGITMSEPFTEPKRAVKAFFKENPRSTYCLIRRVDFRRLTGEVFHDPDYEPKKIFKAELDKAF